MASPIVKETSVTFPARLVCADEVNSSIRINIRLNLDAVRPDAN